MLSLRRPRKPSQTRPSGSTTSSPKASSRALPKRSTAVPPAFVDRLPPIVQLPSDASDSGNSIPRLGGRSLRLGKRCARLDRHRRVRDVDRRGPGSCAIAKARSHHPRSPALPLRTGSCCRLAGRSARRFRRRAARWQRLVPSMRDGRPRAPRRDIARANRQCRVRGRPARSARAPGQRRKRPARARLRRAPP